MVVAGDLAGEDSAGADGNEGEDRLGHQLVVDNDVGSLQDAQRLQRQQIRISRTGADQMDGMDGLSQRCRSLRFAVASTNRHEQVFRRQS